MVSARVEGQEEDLEEEEALVEVALVGRHLLSRLPTLEFNSLDPRDGRQNLTLFSAL